MTRSPPRRDRWVVLVVASLLILGGATTPTAARPPQPLPSAQLTPHDWAAIRAQLPPAQQAYLKASNTGELDFLGSVAIDGATVVVGAYGEDSSATGVDGDQTSNAADGAGAAYVVGAPAIRRASSSRRSGAEDLRMYTL